MQSRFLTGYIAAETGHPDRAAAQYRAILTDDPGQTGVRLALAKAMLALHKPGAADRQFKIAEQDQDRSEEHTSELQSLMRISYAVFCLKKKTPTRTARNTATPHLMRRAPTTEITDQR